MSADADRRTIQQALETGDFDHTAHGSPEHGAVLELLFCERLDLEHVDGPYADARDQDGTPVQIKGCLVEHSNGDRTTPGRWDIWSDTLLQLLADDGDILAAVRDDRDAHTVTQDDFEDYIQAWKRLSAREFAGLIPGDAWHHAHREKGQRARLAWPYIFDAQQVDP